MRRDARRGASMACALPGRRRGAAMVWCALLAIDAQHIDIWSPANDSATPSRDVALGFTSTLPETLKAEDFRICVTLDGEPMTCNALDEMAREQLMLTSLLPGYRRLELTLLRDEVTVATASTHFTVGAGTGQADIRAATGESSNWDRSSYFSTVYETGYWAAQFQMAGVPASGPGSSLQAAANARRTLEDLVKELRIDLVIDAPCGDMTWMAAVDLTADYVGVDVVADVVAKNAATYPSKTFVTLDVADPSSVETLQHLVRGRTLILCRHLLFHLPHRDGRAVLKHLRASGARFLLTSTYVRADDFEPSYVLANGHRTNLLRRPYCARDPDRLYLDASADQYLGLWDLEKGEVLGACD